MSNEDKCIYCREYGNLPCEECEKKAKEKISNTKFIKVGVTDRMPIPFKDVRIITDLDEWGNGYCSENNNWWLHSKFDGKVTHWLEEVPDRESELIEMLERAKQELLTAGRWLGSQSPAISEIDSLIQSVKSERLK